jgi:hypothetical protein
MHEAKGLSYQVLMNIFIFRTRSDLVGKKLILNLFSQVEKDLMFFFVVLKTIVFMCGLENKTMFKRTYLHMFNRITMSLMQNFQ